MGDFALKRGDLQLLQGGTKPNTFPLLSFQPPGKHKRDPSEASQLSFDGEKPPDSSLPKAVNGPVGTSKETTDGRSDKVSDKGISSDNNKLESNHSTKTLASSATSATQGKPDIISQPGRLGNSMEGDKRPGPGSRDRKSIGERPESSHLENFTEEKLANGSLDPSAPFPGSRSKGDSDSGSTSASESMDLTISLSADLSLNRESGSISLKVSSGQRVCRRKGSKPLLKSAEVFFPFLEKSLKFRSLRGCAHAHVSHSPLNSCLRKLHTVLWMGLVFDYRRRN